MAIKRQTAYRVWISTLTSGNYVKQEGWDPNYVEVNGKQISRANLMATVVSKFLSEDGNYGAITIDDGTDTIRCKAFGPDVIKLKDTKVGAVARVIGKVKEYNDEIHLSPELVKEVEDPSWLIAWKLQLGKPPEIIKVEPAPAASPAPVTEKPAEIPEDKGEQATEVIEVQEENYSAKILNIIKDLNKGDGANIKDIIKESKLDEEEAKNLIVGLLKDGDVFEPKKGILKPLD